ncbi:MAG: ABC transporter permease [Candidatus Fimenecus sp.]
MVCKKKQNSKYKKAARILVSVSVWLCLWQILYRLIGTDVLFASPSAVGKRLVELLGTADFWLKTGATLLGITEGYLLGATAGILLAVGTSLSDWLYTFFRPMLTVIKSTPVVSFIILALVWMEKSSVPVFISFLMVMPMVWANLAGGIRETDRDLLEMAHVYGFSKWQIVQKIYIPSVMPSLLTALTTAIGFAWKAGIAAEVISTPRNSIGSQLYNAKVYLETVDLFAWTVVVILLSMLLEKLIVYVVGKISSASKGGTVK